MCRPVQQFGEEATLTCHLYKDQKQAGLNSGHSEGLGVGGVMSSKVRQQVQFCAAAAILERLKTTFLTPNLRICY